mgnify:CR=1 FL=1
MARKFGRTEKEERLLSLLRKAGQVSQPSVPGRPNLPGVPTQRFRPVYSGSGRAAREAARDEAMADRWRSIGKSTDFLERNPDLMRGLTRARVSGNWHQDPALRSAMEAFYDPLEGQRINRSRRRIEQDIPQTRWDRNPNIPVGSYADPMMEQTVEPMDIRGTTYEEDELAWDEFIRDINDPAAERLQKANAIQESLAAKRADKYAQIEQDLGIQEESARAQSDAAEARGDVNQIEPGPHPYRETSWQQEWDALEKAKKSKEGLRNYWEDWYADMPASFHEEAKDEGPSMSEVIADVFAKDSKKKKDK